MNYFINSFVLLFLLPFVAIISAKIDICGQTNGFDLSALDLTTWNLTDVNTDHSFVSYLIKICSPFNDSDNPVPIGCQEKHICKQNGTDSAAIGFALKNVNSLSEGSSSVDSLEALFEGPACDQIPKLNYTLSIRFTCGPHLEYPQHFVTTKCRTHLIWRTYAVCRQKPIQKEVKCFVYDNQSLRRDLTPLIKSREGYYKVLSADQDFYINVCSGITGICSEESTGACIKTGENKYSKVGDYQFYTMEFKSKSAVVLYDHIEMTYRSKSDLCLSTVSNHTSKTTIRFICPPRHQKNDLNFDLEDRSPKLVSNLDCDYQIEWLTEYACPVSHIETSAKKCELSEEIHGFNFNLKSLLKRNGNEFFKIENISINEGNGLSVYDINFNVCGGLGQSGCGESKWGNIAVCLKPKNNTNTKDKVIGLTSEGSLKLVDNKFLLEYKSSSNECKFGDNMISESTVIEFVCDDTKGFDYIGKPEFISLEDCVYSILWKTSIVCPLIRANTSCLATHNNMTFDLSVLRRGFAAEPWIAGISQTHPWSRHAKNEKDVIYLNICGLIPNTLNTTGCDGRASVCMVSGDTNSALNLGEFRSPPKYNEDIKAIELIYDNGIDEQNQKKIKSKFTLRCKPGLLNSEPILVDIDEELGVYEFEWDTSAACPIDSFTGNDCKVYDKFLDFTFDLNPLKNNRYYPLIIGDYEYQINVCGEVISSQCSNGSVYKAVGPFGGCQVETKGQQRIFSLGKVSTSLTYWNGIVNLTLTDGTPYNNPEKTPRKSQISFICDPNIGNGVPEYDGEKNRSYFFRWYTSLVCPQAPKVVHCVWDNGSHILDLTQLAMTNGNHFTVGQSGSDVPSIYYINICRPLNPIHDNHISLKECGPNSAACRVALTGQSPSVLNLGEPTHSPITAFDGSINLFYENGSPCPTKPNERIRTRIKFECDPNADLSNPTVYEPGTEQTESEECVYLFVWRTSAVCDVIQPTKLVNNSCLFTDSRTGLSVDLSSLKHQPNQPYKVSQRQTQSTFELNVCGLSNSMAAPQCTNSAVCLIVNKTQSLSDQSAVNYGLLTSSSFFYDGIDLRLKYFNGSKCMAHSDTGLMSSEIIFKCNPDAGKGEPKLYSSHGCIAVFEWETDLVCNLRLPKCSIVGDKSFYNLRQLSSISHAWNTTDSEGNVYLLNVCTKLPQTMGCPGVNSASCKCRYDSNQKLICTESLGDPSTDELTIENNDLLLTYKNGDDSQCDRGMRAQTQITFKCGTNIGNPKFISFIKQKCIYKMEWKSLMACPVNERNDILLPKNNGFLYDERINTYIKIDSLLRKTFRVNETRPLNGTKDEYIYVINLSNRQSTDSECVNAAVCQTKGDFRRNVGSLESIQFHLRGHELQITLQSFSAKKCGKNKNKNVTTIFRLQCSSYSGLGKPVFVYESNDCDYIFNWETEMVCPDHFLTQAQYENMSQNAIYSDSDYAPTDSPSTGKSSHSNVWIGIFIISLFAITITVLIIYKQRVRQTLMFRFRRLFGTETPNPTFHYHQLAPNEKDRQTDVVVINYNDAHNRNTIAAQPSGHVPYYSIYDDSDVDLLT